MLRIIAQSGKGALVPSTSVSASQEVRAALAAGNLIVRNALQRSGILGHRAERLGWPPFYSPTATAAATRLQALRLAVETAS